MKPENPSESDPLLRQALSEWQVKETLPPRFGEQVWQRIAREEAEPPRTVWAELLTRIQGALTRPSLAVGYVTVLLLAGLLAGYRQAQVDNARVSHQLGAGYVQMMTSYEALHP